MKIRIKGISIALVMLAVVIPSYWFVGGRKINNLIYYAAFALLILDAFTHKGNTKIRNGYIPWILILSLVLYGIQALLDSGIGAAINELLAGVVVVIVALNAVKTEKDITRYIDALIFFSAPLLLFGIIESITATNIFQASSLTIAEARFYFEYRIGLFRISSVFGHPIVYCNYLSLISALCVYRMSNVIRRRRYNVIRIIYIFAIVNAILTVSRSLILVFIAEQIVLYAIKGEKLLSSKKIFVALAIILLLVFSDLIGLPFMSQIEDMINMLLQVFGLGSAEYSSSFSSMGYSGVSGDRWRLYAWVLSSMGSNLVFGNGTYASFSYLATEYRVKNSIENYYLDILFHHGIVGLVGMILGWSSLIVYSFKHLKNNKKKNLRMSSEGKLTFNVVMACLILGELVAYFMVNQSGEIRLFYICLGLLFAYNATVNKKTEC